MRQQATVYHLENKKTAIVEVVRHSACGGNCESCKGCSHSHEEQIMRVRAVNQIGAGVGERVWLENETKEVFASIGIAYVLPILLLIAGYFLAPVQTEGLRILSSGIGFLLGVGLCWLYAQKLGRRGETRAVITDWVRG